MKVGILTFHYAHNYGAMLQTYATQRLLAGMGHDPEVIDYRNAFIENGYRKVRNQPGRISAYPAWLLKYPFSAFSRRIRYGRFERFMASNLRLSERVTADRIGGLTGYDALLFGSDQIWNPLITGGPDDVYWGNFPASAKKIAWAASMNAREIAPAEAERIRRCLQHFDAVSVREDSLRELLAPLSDNPIRVLPDPTLLLSREEWLADMQPRQKDRIPYDYVLAYPMLFDREVLEIARALARRTGKKLIILGRTAGWRPYPDTVQWAGPQDFVRWIADAAAVVTSSFHGTAFSVLLEKPFYCVVPPGGHNLRTDSLLEQLGLHSRIVSTLPEAGSLPEPDFGTCRMRLAEMRESAAAFLKNALEGSPS